MEGAERCPLAAARPPASGISLSVLPNRSRGSGGILEQRRGRFGRRLSVPGPRSGESPGHPTGAGGPGPRSAPSGPPSAGGRSPACPVSPVPSWVEVPQRRSPRSRAGAGPRLCWRNAGILCRGRAGVAGKGPEGGTEGTAASGAVPGAPCQPRHRAAPPGNDRSSWLRGAEPWRTKHTLAIFNLFFKKSEFSVGTGKAGDEDPPLFMGKSSVHMYLV